MGQPPSSVALQTLPGKSEVAGSAGCVLPRPRAIRTAAKDATEALAGLLQSKLPDFRLGPGIGQGGMVFRAHQPKLRREVAIKALTARPGAAAVGRVNWTKRFLREAQ